MTRTTFVTRIALLALAGGLLTAHADARGAQRRGDPPGRHDGECAPPPAQRIKPLVQCLAREGRLNQLIPLGCSVTAAAGRPQAGVQVQFSVRIGRSGGVLLDYATTDARGVAHIEWTVAADPPLASSQPRACSYYARVVPSARISDGGTLHRGELLVRP